jgi:hypothetical protein
LGKAPDPEAHKIAFAAWQAAGVPGVVLSFQGTTHFDYSLLPTFLATSWCPDTSTGACRGGWAAQRSSTTRWRGSIAGSRIPASPVAVTRTAAKICAADARNESFDFCHFPRRRESSFVVGV